MSSINPNDRASLCQFTFSDGRRCRSPRVSSASLDSSSEAASRFCYDHAQKDLRERTAAQLGDDFAALFSGTYVSACDLSAALARLIQAVARGHIKPRTASTLAYLAQTLFQSIRLSQHEFVSTFGNNAWRKAIGDSVNHNLRYLRAPAQTQPPVEPQTTSSQPQPQTQSTASTRQTTATAPQSAPKSVGANGKSQLAKPVPSEDSSIRKFPPQPPIAPLESTLTEAVRNCSFQETYGQS